MPDPGEIGSILIIKLSSVGDIVMSLPAVHQLKRLTQARITWVADEGMKPLLKGNPDIDDLLVFPRNPFQERSRKLPEEIRKIRALVRGLRRRPFDLAIDLQGRGRSYLILKVARAQLKIGRGRFPFLDLRTDHHWRTGLHAVESYTQILELLGWPQRPPENAAVYGKTATGRAGGMRTDWKLSRLGVTKPVVCLLPATTWVSKHWPEASWADLAGRLAARGYAIVLAGSEREQALGERIRRTTGASEKVFCAFGVFDLDELCGLFERSELVVSGDTGPMHLAAQTCVPLVSLFGPTEPALTGPWPPGRAVSISAPDCRVCWRPRCRRRCLDRIGVEEVMAAVDRALSGKNSGGPK